MEQPQHEIASYTDQNMGRKQTVALFRDAIRIKTNLIFHADVDATYSLRDLNPQFVKVRYRQKAFWQGVSMFTVLTIAAAIAHSLPRNDFLSENIDVITFLPTAGVIVALAAFRKIESVVVYKQSGQSAFSIEKSGREKTKYGFFVQLLEETIRTQKEQA